ncbi:hypothetical protein NL676_008913 [Syzygium grande]|nr:hypothetical protein NL676_008913 [Syzygium grande]
MAQRGLDDGLANDTSCSEGKQHVESWHGGSGWAATRHCGVGVVGQENKKSGESRDNNRSCRDGRSLGGSSEWSLDSSFGITGSGEQHGRLDQAQQQRGIEGSRLAGGQQLCRGRGSRGRDGNVSVGVIAGLRATQRQQLEAW